MEKYYQVTIKDVKFLEEGLVIKRTYEVHKLKYNNIFEQNRIVRKSVVMFIESTKKRNI